MPKASEGLARPIIVRRAALRVAQANVERIQDAPTRDALRTLIAEVRALRVEIAEVRAYAEAVETRGERAAGRLAARMGG